MNDDVKYALVDAACEAGVELRSYSGRAMYGKQCVALVLEDGPGDLVRFVTSMAQDPGITDDLLRLLANNIRQDSLGYGTVYYWPRLPWDEE